MKNGIFILMACLASISATAHAAPVEQEIAPPAPQVNHGRYSTVTTPLGVLTADPAAKAVLVKYLPKLMGNPDVSERASGMSLREIQDALKAYAPDLITDSILTQIDQEFASISPSRP